MEPPRTDSGRVAGPGPGPRRRSRVFILAEVRFYREGLVRFFAEQPKLDVVGSAENAAAALELAPGVGPEVVLLDMSPPTDCDAARALSVAVPNAALVALGVHEDEDEVVALAEAGVTGFVARDASLHELTRAVETAAGGGTQCSPRVAAMLARRVSTLAQQIRSEPPDVPLTRRQLEIVRLIGEGLQNKAIAQRLFIEVPTVKNHVHNILERLGVARREDAVSVVRMRSPATPLS